MTRALDAHDGDVLTDYVDGMLDPAQTCAVERHISVCLHCCAFVREQREVIARMRCFTLGRQGQHDLAASLLNLAHEVRAQEAPFRPHGPATLAASAPAQYASARRSVACAVFAVAGCLGAALVAVQVPAGASGGPASPAQRDGTSVVRQVPGVVRAPDPVERPIGLAAMLQSNRP